MMTSVFAMAPISYANDAEYLESYSSGFYVNINAGQNTSNADVDAPICSEGNPYKIGSALELVKLSSALGYSAPAPLSEVLCGRVKADDSLYHDSDVYIKLTNDIDLGELYGNTNLEIDWKILYGENSEQERTKTFEWVPIGASFPNSMGFNGHFDGDGHIIKKLKVDTTNSTDSTNTEDSMPYHQEKNTGLFGVLGPNSTIKNLGIVDANVKGSNDTGILAGSSCATIISNVFVTGSVSGGGNVGGLVGFAGGISCGHLSHIDVTPREKISNSFVNVSVESYGVCSGGIVGYSESLHIDKVYVLGKLMLRRFPDVFPVRPVASTFISLHGRVGGEFAYQNINYYYEKAKYSAVLSSSLFHESLGVVVTDTVVLSDFFYGDAKYRAEYGVISSSSTAREISSLDSVKSAKWWFDADDGPHFSSENWHIDDDKLPVLKLLTSKNVLNEQQNHDLTGLSAPKSTQETEKKRKVVHKQHVLNNPQAIPPSTNLPSTNLGSAPKSTQETKKKRKVVRKQHVLNNTQAKFQVPPKDKLNDLQRLKQTQEQERAFNLLRKIPISNLEEHQELVPVSKNAQGNSSAQGPANMPVSRKSPQKLHKKLH
ncbi:MAG: hypothetical protein LBI63_04280, partial [Candidatus Ancillula sp.]|nr:hypothetical protein [Candidatus Ancillula sp.]